jgi:galactokinase
MYASHDSLRDDYEVSCPELDEIVRLARVIGPAGGILGCRMTGGGFGGCAIALARQSCLASIQNELETGYRARFGISPGFFITRAAAGASSLALDK